MADSNRQRAFISQWLAGTLAPGDRVIAGVPAVTGPSPYLDLLPALLAAVAGGLGWWREFYSSQQLGHVAAAVLGALATGGAWLSLLVITRRKSIYLAVTEQQLVAVQLKGWARPHRVLFATPIATTQLTTGSVTLLPVRTIWWASASGPISVGGRFVRSRDRVRLNVKARRAAFEDVLTAVRLHGGAVDVPALPMARLSS